MNMCRNRLRSDDAEMDDEARVKLGSMAYERLKGDLDKLTMMYEMLLVTRGDKNVWNTSCLSKELEIIVTGKVGEDLGV